MTAIILKKHLHNAIDNINDSEFLEAVYKIISAKNIQNEFSISDSDWSEIEHRRQLHKSGKSKSYSWIEAKKIIKKQLK
jgi:hypothetical protein